MAQQTGLFTFSALSLQYFDPQTELYEEATAEPVSVAVVPAKGGAIAVGGDRSHLPSEPKNILPAGGARPLRYRASFQGEQEPIWRAAFFLPSLLGPPAVWLGLILFGLVRSRFNQQDESSVRRRRTRAAHRRLARADALKASGTAEAFYAEVEKALREFLEVRLGVPIIGLTRTVLAERLDQAGVPEEQRVRILQVLDACDQARFAPGGNGGQRDWVLEQVQTVMDRWK